MEDMYANLYQKAAVVPLDPELSLDEAIEKLAGFVGEVKAAKDKQQFVDMVIALGKVTQYTAAISACSGVTMADVMMGNIKLLAKEHPDLYEITRK